MTLREYILSNNNYFTDGFDNAFQQDGIYCRRNNDLLQIFPNDNNGNYFYIRQIGNITFNKIQPKPYIYQDKTSYKLVAIVSNADPNKLINNLRSTLLNYSEIDVKDASFIRELIIIAELQRMKNNIIQKALQRLKNETIVSISFDLYSTFIASNCKIINPCNDECM